jgi:hypothetical protein
VDGRRLPLQTDTFAIYVIRRGDTVRTGTLVDALRMDRDRLVRVYDQQDQVLGPQLDTIISRLRDLAPIRYSDRSRTRVAQLDFVAGRVDGWTRLPDGESLGVHVKLPARTYDGTSFDLIVRSAELRDSLELAVPVFVAGSNTVPTIEGRVTGSALMDGADCWVFRANFTGMPVTFWIDKRTRALRRQLMQPVVDASILFAAPRPPARAGRAT